VLAVITVPAWVYAPRLDLQQRLASGQVFDTPLHTPVLTHWLHNEQEDSVCRFLRDNGMQNQDADGKVKIIFVPCYLDGRDGIFDLPYYDILIGEDLAVYPSYYEPWGYTPLEAVAFHVPCVTTSLSGFGMWADKQKKGESQITDGVAVVPRDDYNWNDVCDAVCRIVQQCDAFDEKTWTSVRRRAASLASKALWSKFIENYLTAYRIALQNAAKRCAAK
ncbi:MAG: glycosyltransferase, partial [Bacteroidaceae bacterium]|nr:glycosyltransferase [Bacteroidaceae bacterium]